MGVGITNPAVLEAEKLAMKLAISTDLVTLERYILNGMFFTKFY